MSNQSFVILLLICLGAYWVDQSKNAVEAPAEPLTESAESLTSDVNQSVFSDQPWPDVGALTQPTSATFQCDGRRYCSEMRSLEEARFFIQSCPNTQMDGDHDGEPCENDSRFH